MRRVKLCNDEIAQARRIIQAVGGAPPRIVKPRIAATTVGLPGSCLVVIRKTRPTPDRYPRSPANGAASALP